MEVTSRRRTLWTLAGVLAVAVLLGLVMPASAQYGAWHYSRNVDIAAGSVARTDSPVELRVNFTSWLSAAGASGKTLDLNSIRVAEYSDTGRNTLIGEVPSQFDQGAGFDAKTNASGELVWILSGSTSAGATRYFRVYFDATENGSMTAPSYTPGVTWDAGARTVETTAYKAVYSATKAGLTRFENKLTGSAKVMWDASESGYPNYGSWHTINEAPWWVGWIDDFGGNDEAQSSVSAGPVRVTITTTRNEGRTFWTIIRRYYAGTPYIKVSATGASNPHDGSGILFLKRVVWSQVGAASTRAVVPPDNFNGTVTHDVVFDYGADGGLGVASSFNFAPNSSEDYEANSMLRQAQFDCWGETWLTGGYPISMDYAFVCHDQTTESGAQSAMSAAWQDYNDPVTAIVQNDAVVRGVITDASTAQPIRNAVVRLRSGSVFSATVRSSATGAFTIQGVPAGTATFSVRADGYDYYSSTPSVAAGSNSVNAALSATPSINLRSTALGGQVEWLLGMDTLAGGPVVPPNDDFSAKAASEAAFIPTEVPGNWDVQQGALANLYGWYRTHVAIPGDWAGKTLRMRNYAVHDVDATWFNGTKVGQTGVFPSAADPRNSDTSVRKSFQPRVYWIPSSAVQAGADNVIAVRVYDADAFLEGTEGGFVTARPILEIAPPTATVTGVVSGPGGPISGAVVELVGVGSVTTGANGSYSFSNVLGEVYQLKATAFGYKDYSATLDVPDSGTLTKNVSLESAGSVSGVVTRNGSPLRKCRVYWTGPTNGSMLTDDSGSYSFTALPGTYTVVFNALKVIPTTKDVNVSGQTTLNVDLPYGVTPIYDGFAGNSLDMSKWQYANLAAAAGAGDAVATVSGGVLKLEMAQNRGGIMSTASFPAVCTHEVMFPRPYVGTNQIMNLYGGTGGFGSFVEIGNEGFGGGIFSGVPQVAVYGTSKNPKTLAWAGYPMSVAAVRTHNYYDFYIDGIYYDISDTSSGLTHQDARIYLYGWEPTDGETIGFFGAVAAGTPVAPETKGLGDARNAATGEAVSVSGAVVTASFGEAFWIESPDRSAGVKVMSATVLTNTTNPVPGSVVNVVGRVAHVNGEAVIQKIDYAVTGTAPVPEPVTMANRPAGGGDTPGAAAQGLLATVFGKVTGVVLDTNSNVAGFFLDDGSGLPGDGTHKGLYVPITQAWLDAGFQPPFGPEIFPEWATVTGVITVSTLPGNASGELVPAIRCQNYTDINIEIVF